MFFTNPFKSRLPEAEEALKGRAAAIMSPGAHAAHGRPIAPPFPKDVQLVQLGLGCFWGAERLFWTQEGVYSTAVGYAGGRTPNPTYEEVCSGQTGHSEVVLVAFQPDILSFEALLAIFGKAMTRHRAIVREMILARNIALLSIHHLLKCWRRRGALPVIMARNWPQAALGKSRQR